LYLLADRPVNKDIQGEEIMAGFSVIGIDPGKSGCLWAIDSMTRQTVSFHDVQRLGNDIDIWSIVEFMKQFDPKLSIVMSENPHPHGNTGVKTVYAGFEYGKGVGTIYGIVVAMGFKLLRVSPPTWKGYFAINSSKSTYLEKKKLSVEKACYLSPADAKHFNYTRFDKKVSKHDRAEAFLIAIYCLENHLVIK
jgi:hypothetical protein